MDNVNVLESDVGELEKLRDKLILLNQYNAQLANEDLLEEQLEQQISEKQNMIEAEIQEVINKRECEIVNSFEEQISRQKNKLKKVQDKKKKSKDEKMKDRILKETSSLREENQKLYAQGKMLFHEGKIAGIFQKQLYFTLFAPKGIADYLTILVTILIAFAAVPKLLYIIIKPQNNALFYTLVYVAVSVIVFGIYYLVYQATKGKNAYAVEQVRQLYHLIRQNNRKMNKIKRKIRKDKDESGYHLESYDKEMKELNHKIMEITQQQSEAVATLRNTTSHILAGEIRAKYQMEVSELSSQYEQQKLRIHDIEERIKVEMAELTTTYQAYLGSELMNIQAVDQLITIMNEQKIPCISEALEVYRGNMQKEGSLQ